MTLNLLSEVVSFVSKISKIALNKFILLFLQRYNKVNDSRVNIFTESNMKNNIPQYTVLEKGCKKHSVLVHQSQWIDLKEYRRESWGVIAIDM